MVTTHIIPSIMLQVEAREQTAIPTAPPGGVFGAAGAVTNRKGGGSITAAQRHALPASDFALPGERYPVDTKARARNALARVSQFGTAGEKTKVRAKVHRKYPEIGEK